jgi:hypothetical protein
MSTKPTEATPAHPLRLVVDNDIRKGAVEENRSGPQRSAHPGLDGNGLPNDPVAIAQDALGARDDQSQG